MQLSNNPSGEYVHIRGGKIINVKQIVGKYVLIEDKQELVVIARDVLFDNFKKIPEAKKEYLQ